MKFHIIAGFIVKTFIGVIEALLGIRFFLKILGASQTAPFVRWIYDSGAGFLEPFWGMFPELQLGPYFVFEVSTLFAMFVYAIFGLFTLRILEFVYRQIIENLADAPPITPSKTEHHAIGADTQFKKGAQSMESTDPSTS